VEAEKQSQKSTIAWIVIAVGVLIRCYNVSAPLLDLASWRETQTAMITRNLVKDGLDLLHPRVDWFGNNTAYLALEFPLYNGVIAIFYVVFGEQEIFGRILSILFSAGGMVLFYKLARLFFQEKVALYSLLFYMLCPLSIFYSQTYMPESMMLFFSIGAIYFLLRWRETDQKTQLALAIAFTLGALLVKTPVAVQLALPVLYLFWVKYGNRILLRPETYVFFLLTYVPLIAWALHAQNLTHTYFPEENLSKFVIDTAARLDPRSYLRVAGFLVIYLFLPHGLILFGYGTLSKKLAAGEGFLYVWLAGLVIYLFVFFPALEGHHYYLVPVVPVVSLLVGKGIHRSAGAFRRWRTTEAVKWGLAAAAGVTLLACIRLPLSHLSKQDYIFLQAANAVKRQTSPSDLVLSATFHARKNAFSNPALLYYAHRRGWLDLFPYDMEKLLQTINTHKSEGASYLLVTYSSHFEERSILGKFSSHRPDFDGEHIVDELKGRFAVVEAGDGYVLYRL